MNNNGKEKNFGLLGTVFILLTPIPYIGFLLSIAGIILLLISMYNFSQIYNDKNIFNKFLIGWVMGFVGIFIALILGLGSLLPAMLLSESSGREDAGMAMFGFGIIFAILIFYIIFVFGSYFYKQSFDLLGQYTGVNLFNLAGNIIFWGAVGIILFGLGFLAMYVGWILIAVAFYSIPQSKETPPPQPTSSP
ncbi:MAG: DUF996 domain-containing protein [Candidatus Hydrogenedens sp.]|nr:DUF996 domain-containing protein [Candidatus Hydrogenedens sp.]